MVPSGIKIGKEQLKNNVFILKNEIEIRQLFVGMEKLPES
jgi:hypothetical protein